MSDRVRPDLPDIDVDDEETLPGEGADPDDVPALTPDEDEIDDE